jgi:two-component system, cell cycle response regulator DivK
MKKIMVVEDNDTNLYLVRFILEKSGYTVVEARNGLAAVATAIRELPNLIIMDIQLPDISGLEATRRIRASEANGKTPIVALTSYAMVGDREKALEAGCTGYIEKPINPETFVQQIQEYLKTQEPVQ